MDTQTTSYGRRPFTFDRVVRIIISLICLYAALWLVRRLSSVLLPFCVAWLIAYLLEPIVQRNRRIFNLKGRMMAILLTLIGIVMMCMLLCVTLLPSIFDEMHQLAALVSAYAETRRDVQFIPPQVHEFIVQHFDFKAISDTLTRQNLESLLEMVTGFVSGGVDILLGIFDWFLVVLYVIFIMLDYEKLLHGFRRAVPPRYRGWVFSVFNDVKDSMNHYFRGQALIAFLVGVLFSIGFLVVGLPLAIVLGMFIGLLNMVPYLQLISLPVTTLLCLVYSVHDNIDFWPLWWECMAVYAVVQVIQDLYLTPRIMGKAMGLNPALILLSLSVWGSLLGIIGMIIALPLTTLLIAYYNQYLSHRDDGETPSQRKADIRAVDDIAYGD